jgi:hypothetical protein
MGTLVGARQVEYLTTATGGVARTAHDRSGDVVSVKDFGAKGDGTTNDTTAIQAALNSGATRIIIPDGNYRITARIVQSPGTIVECTGYLVPDASTWSDAYVYQIFDNWNNPTADFINGQYLRGNRTAVYGLKINPSAPIAATGLYGSDGLGIVIEDLHVWNCNVGGVRIQNGAEWRLRSAQIIAPYERTSGSRGLEIDTADSIIQSLVVVGYPYGVYFVSTSNNTDVIGAHVWGQPAAQNNPAWTALTAYTANMYVSNGGNSYRCKVAGTSASSGGPSGTGTAITDGTVTWTYVGAGAGAGRMLNYGFWFDGGGSNTGGSNRCWACIADTPERIVAGTPAGTTNGGLGFYIENWNNLLSGAWVIGTANLSKAYVINNAQGNSLIGCSAPFDATRFETGGYVVLQGTATANNNNVIGGTFNRDAQMKVGPSWWDPANGNMFWGAAAVSPGTDANVGVAIYNNGSIGLTRNGGAPLFLNRTTSAGDSIVINKDGTTFGRIGSNGASTITITFGSAGATISHGSGAPEGVITAPVGSIWIRSDGAASTSAYLKESGAGNTGWRAIGTQSTSADRGDTNQTLTAGTDAKVQRWATTLTANRTVTLSTTGAADGDSFRVVRTGLGAFTLAVGALKTIPSATAAFVDVMYSSAVSAWVLTGYGTL